MPDNTENHTVRLLQEMRSEMRQGFEDMNTRIDGLTHILTLLAGEIHQQEQRLEKLEERDV